MQFYPVFCHFIPCWSRYSTKHLFSNILKLSISSISVDTSRSINGVCDDPLKDGNILTFEKALSQDFSAWSWWDFSDKLSYPIRSWYHRNNVLINGFVTCVTRKIKSHTELYCREQDEVTSNRQTSRYVFLRKYLDTATEIPRCWRVFQS